MSLMARKFFTTRPRANTSTGGATEQAIYSPDTLNPKRSNTFAGIGERSHGRDRRQYYAVQPSSIPEPEQEGDLIGVALGSPTAYWPHPSGGTVIATAASNSDTDLDRRFAEGDIPLRRKPSKWKKIGGLFKTKNVPDPPKDDLFYQVQVNGQPLHPSSTDNSTTAFQFTSRPFSPQDRNLEHDPRPTRQKSHGKLVKEPAQRHRGAWTDQPQDGSRNDSATPPLLNVEIPEVEMERYSVMFANLLGKEPRSTILARRSRTLDRLETFQEEPAYRDRLPLRRYATSPAPTKSPTFTLFPTVATPRRPSKSSVSRVKPFPERSDTTASAPHGGLSDPRPYELSRPSNENPTSLHDRFDSENSFLSTTSPSTDSVSDSGIEEPSLLRRSRPAPPVDLTEPDWEIVHASTTVPRPASPSTRVLESSASFPQPPTFPSSPPKFSLSPPASSQGKEITVPPQPIRQAPRPPRSSSARQAPIPRQLPLRARSSGRQPTILQEPPTPSIDDFSEDPVVVSVARSISVTKRQPHRIVPVNASVGNNLLRPLNQDEQIIEKQVGMPTLQAVQRGHVHKKSHHLVIETM